MISYKRGDVVLVPFPFTDFTTTKQRPAVVLSSDLFNGSHPDTVVAAITSRVGIPPASDEIPLSSEDLKLANLMKPSVVKPFKLVTIDQRLIRKKIGRLTPSSLHTIEEQLKALFSIGQTLNP